MSNLNTPSTDYDTTTTLTEETDAVEGGGGADLFIGEVSDGGLVTLDPSDEINGMDGEDTLRVTATGASAEAVGFSSENVETLEVRNLTSDDTFWADLINTTGFDTFWSNNTTGKTILDNIQDEAHFVVTGGPNGSPATLKANFNDNLYQGDSDHMDLLVDDANVDFEVNDYEGGPAVETLHILGKGDDSKVEFDVAGVQNLKITGNASNLDVEQENYNGPMEYLHSIDAAGFGGNLELDAYVGNDGAEDPATVVTADGDDDLDLDGDYYSDVEIRSNGGEDTVYADDFMSAFVRLGDQGDEAVIGDHYGSGIHGDVDLNSGKGKDVVSVYNSGDLLAAMGGGGDTLNMYVGGDATVKAGAGHDTVSGSVSGDLMLDLGNGRNYVDIDVGESLTNLTALEGNDTVYADVYYGATIDVGEGNNYIDLDFGMWSGHDVAMVTAGSGNDTLYAASGAGGDDLIAKLGAGNDYADIEGMSTTSADITFASGDDRLETGSRGVVSSDSLKFGGGNDKIYVNNLEIVNDTNDFAGVVSAENLYFSDGSGNVTFDGVTTKANAAGIMNYWHDDGDVDRDYDMRNLSDGVALNMSIYNGRTDLSVDLATTGAATVNLAGRGHYGWSNDGFDYASFADIHTLTINTTDSNYGGWGTPIIDVGYYSFDDKTAANPTGGDLTTLKLTGTAGINLASTKSGVSAVNLATIDGVAMTAAVSMKLTDVADGISVTTGSGNDLVNGVEAGSSYDVSTGFGNDTVMTVDGDDTIDAGGGNDWVNSGAGIDDIDMGEGNDTVQFEAGNLTDADTVQGGGGSGDVVQITAGGLGKVVDDLFFNWGGVEHLILNSGFDDLTLKNIANDNGPGEITLGGGSDKVTLGEGFNRELTINISTGSADNINGTGTTNNQANLVVRGLVSAFNDDTIKAGTSTADELIMTADNGTADFTVNSNVRGIETITVLRGAAPDRDATIITENTNVAPDNVLLVNAKNLVDVDGPGGWSAGNLTFDGTAETNGGIFDVIGGDGNDTILTGNGADTILSSNGNDSIESNGGADSIDSGSGNDSILSGGGGDSISAGSGNDTINSEGGLDTIDGGAGNDDIIAGNGSDIVNGGSGNDTIEGGQHADDLTGGLGNDIFVYTGVGQSQGANNSIDTIKDFGQVSGDDDKIDLNGIGGTWDFVGSKADFGSAQGQLTGTSGEVVFQEDNGTLWMDKDGNGILNGQDLQVKLTGVDSMSIDDFVPAGP